MEWDYDKGYINLFSKIKVLSECSTIGADASKHSSMYTNTDRPYFEARNKHLGVTRHELVKNKMRDSVCNAINQFTSNGGKLDSHDKYLCKYLLYFQSEEGYNEMLLAAKTVMNILPRPLDVEYKQLHPVNAQILELKLNEKDKMNNVKSNLQLLVDTYKHWYKPFAALFWPKDIKPLSHEWIKLRLNLIDKEFTDIWIRNSKKSLNFSEMIGVIIDLC